ncbi:MAG: DUF357 domain-containing protein [Candidatus Micrarchaeota archaeon]
MDQKERAKKDLDKLTKMMSVFRSLGLDKKYPRIMEYAENYGHDAKHFFEKGDYFTSFGAANYAYGFIDAILVVEGKKDEHML